MLFRSYYNPGGVSAVAPRGVEGSIRVTAANAQNFTGIWQALRGVVVHGGTGTMDDVRLCDVSYARDSTGTVTDLYGYFMAAFPAAGVTNGYGLYLGNVTGTANAYAIYTGTGLVRLGDIINYAGAMGDSGKDPTTDAPDDWVECEIGGATYYLPAYTAS